MPLARRLVLAAATLAVVAVAVLAASSPALAALSPVKIDISRCQPSPTLQKGPCVNDVIPRCQRDWGIKMRWVGPDCATRVRVGGQWVTQYSGKGGCQCGSDTGPGASPYCGWTCKCTTGCVGRVGSCAAPKPVTYVANSCAVATIAPVPKPTNVPVVPPTLAPVVPPTLAPVVPPTLAPVVPPTDAPVVPPTLAPVVPPTRAPVVPPTDAPVVPPTNMPTVSPGGSLPPSCGRRRALVQWGWSKARVARALGGCGPVCTTPCDGPSCCYAFYGAASPCCADYGPCMSCYTGIPGGV